MYNKCHHPKVTFIWNNSDLKYTHTHIYIYSDTWDTLYLFQVGIQGVSHIQYNAINCINKSSSMQKEQ